MSQSGGQLLAQQAADAVTLLASITDAVAHTITKAPVFIPRPSLALPLELNVTAAAAAVGDTLDVKVQTTIDGTNWTDVCHFTQVLGNGGAVIIYAKLQGDAAQAMYTDGALAAGSVRHLFGDQYRVSYTIGDGGAHGQSFTFSVTARPM